MEIRSNEQVAALIAAEMRRQSASYAATVPGARLVDSADVRSGHDEVFRELALDLRETCAALEQDAEALRATSNLIASSDAKLAFALHRR